jgi:GNAT superfamily N-acetyltransferase
VGGALERHLRTWLGAWPPAGDLEIVGCAGRERPGWDERLHPLVVVAEPAGAVVSVPRSAVEAVERVLAGLSDTGPAPRADAAAGPVRWPSALAAAVGAPGRAVTEMTFRFTTQPAPLPDAGEWTLAEQPGLPAWLRMFAGAVLVARDASGAYAAGVGIKRHDRHGHELAVGTAPAARGRGLARRLVAQAARDVLAAGAVPTYAHDPGNLASARVAEAAGFPDRGWRIVRLDDGDPGTASA